MLAASPELSPLTLAGCRITNKRIIVKTDSPVRPACCAVPCWLCWAGGSLSMREGGEGARTGSALACLRS